MRMKTLAPANFLAWCVLLWSCGCHPADPTQQRLEKTISELKKTAGGSEWSVARRNEHIIGLMALEGKRLEKAHILHAACMPNRTSGFTFVVDYADVQPRTQFFRVYDADDRVLDLVETDSAKAWNRLAVKDSVLYSAVWVFDASDPPSFGRDKEAYVEIHNQDGTVSSRVRVQMLPAQNPTTASSSPGREGASKRGRS